jgi:hypothetical protein
MKGVDVVLVIFIVLLAVVLGLWGYTAFFTVEGVLLQPTTESQVTIDTVINFIESANLVDINFGNVDPPVSDVGADHNTDGPLTSTLFIEGGPGSTVDLEICISATGDLLNGPFNIPLAGETYSVGFNDNQPAGPGGSISLTTLNVDTATAPIGVGDQVYFRYWLDVPNAAQEAGPYTNNINYAVRQDGTPC